jgi:hypothetical protein
MAVVEQGRSDELFILVGQYWTSDRMAKGAARPHFGQVGIAISEHYST